MSYAIKAGLVVVIAAGFVSWRYVQPATPAIHIGLLLGISRSDGDGCKELDHLARRGYKEVRRDPRSTLRVFLTGTKATALEPSEVSTLPVPHEDNIVTGDSRQEAEREATYFADLRRTCREIAPSDTSPIYVGLRRVVEQVRTAGEPGAIRRVYAKLDLEETAEPGIRAALRDTVGAPLRNLPAPIPNDNVDVHVCSYAVTIGEVTDSGGRVRRFTRPRTAAKIDRAREVWEALVTNKSRLYMEPFCSVHD